MNAPMITKVLTSEHETDEVKTITFSYPGSMFKKSFASLYLVSNFLLE